MSVSSLLAHDHDHDGGASDFKLRQTEKVLKRDVHNTDRISNHVASESVRQSVRESHHQSHIHDDEFITVKVAADLPRIFLHNYFDNFEYVYGFINKPAILDQVDKIDFCHEAIVNLDVYLLLSVGCLIYDSNNKTTHFDRYFKEKVQSIIDEILYNKDNLKNLILLTILSICNLNEELCWNLLGILIRLIIKHGLYKPTTMETERMVWTVFNLDKEVSLLLNRPSQFPRPEFVKLELPNTKLYHDENVLLINQYIKFAQFEDKLLTLSLTGKCQPEELTDFSSQLESWRVSTSSLIHTEFSNCPKLQDYITFTNLNYYYLLIEIDQLSPSESFQFTLQFLSNSFSLILQEPNRDKVANNEICINTVYWYNKLFKIIRFNVSSLKNLVESQTISKLDLSMKLSESNSNLQLTINLLKYLKTNSTKQVAAINILLDTSITILTDLNLALMNFNSITTSDDEKNILVTKVDRAYTTYYELITNAL